MAELGGDQAARISVASATDADGVPVITVAGDLDISNAQTLETAVTAAAADHSERLVLDLSGLRFMDSAGIAVLLGAVSSVRTVYLREPSPAVRRVLEVTGLAGVVSIGS